MAQRWMQAKLILARSHGVTISGHGRATGAPWEDRPIGTVDAKPVPPPKGKARNVILKPLHAQPVKLRRKIEALRQW